ncbi:uncharacterized protein DS421_17g583960 [Arachis hypogaea]|nr:uncharacterized protein DS421_17g583960 [Arachis hypogaea]
MLMRTNATRNMTKRGCGLSGEEEGDAKDKRGGLRQCRETVLGMTRQRRGVATIRRKAATGRKAVRTKNHTDGVQLSEDDTAAPKSGDEEEEEDSANEESHGRRVAL